MWGTRSSIGTVSPPPGPRCHCRGAAPCRHGCVALQRRPGGGGQRRHHAGTLGDLAASLPWGGTTRFGVLPSDPHPALGSAALSCRATRTACAEAVPVKAKRGLKMNERSLLGRARAAATSKHLQKRDGEEGAGAGGGRERRQSPQTAAKGRGETEGLNQLKAATTRGKRGWRGHPAARRAGLQPPAPQGPGEEKPSPPGAAGCAQGCRGSGTSSGAAFSPGSGDAGHATAALPARQAAPGSTDASVSRIVSPSAAPAGHGAFLGSPSLSKAFHK